MDPAHHRHCVGGRPAVEVEFGKGARVRPVTALDEQVGAAAGRAQPVVNDAGRAGEVAPERADADPRAGAGENGIGRRGRADETGVFDPVVAGILHAEAPDTGFRTAPDLRHPDPDCKGIQRLVVHVRRCQLGECRPGLPKQGGRQSGAKHGNLIHRPSLAADRPPFTCAGMKPLHAGRRGERAPDGTIRRLPGSCPIRRRCRDGVRPVRSVVRMHAQKA